MIAHRKALDPGSALDNLTPPLVTEDGRERAFRVFAGQADAFGQSRQSADELTYRL